MLYRQVEGVLEHDSPHHCLYCHHIAHSCGGECECLELSHDYVGRMRYMPL